MILARWTVELWLSALNCRHVSAHAGTVPTAFQGFIDQPTYEKSITYTLAKERFGNIEGVYSTAVLMVVLFSGVLPWAFEHTSQALGHSVWVMAAFLFVIGLALSMLGLPFDWVSQFRLEQKFGFNTTTRRTWWFDRLKILLLSLILGYPLLVLLLKMVAWTGQWWWLWDWGAVIAIQLVLSVLAPILILPMFNKLTPLPEGGLRDGLLELAKRTRFRARSIQLMDGSRRSRHLMPCAMTRRCFPGSTKRSPPPAPPVFRLPPVFIRVTGSICLAWAWACRSPAISKSFCFRCPVPRDGQ